MVFLFRKGCSEDEAGAELAEVADCAGGAAAQGGGGGGGGTGGGEGVGGGAGVASSGGTGGEPGSARQGEECPQCGMTCRNLHVLQLHLEDIHKTSFASIDKHDLSAQFSQVVSIH